MKTNKNLNSVAFASVVVSLFLLIVASSTASATPVTCNVVGTHYECSSWSNEKYPAINLFGEKYVPLLVNSDPMWKSQINKLARPVIDSKDQYTVTTGDIFDLGEGYTLEVRDIDAADKSVWLEFDKDGQYIDDAVVSTNNDSDKTWTCTLDNIQGVNNVPVLKVHVKKVFQGTIYSIVQIDGFWLIDYTNIKVLKIGDKVGEYTLNKINSGVDASNLGSLVFENTLNSPTAAFFASPTSGKAPLKVQFTDKSSNSPTSWKWSFGDGKYSAEKNPAHTYSKAGKYTVSLTVKNAAGSNTLKRSSYINAADPLKAPIASFSVFPRSGKAPLKVQFTDKSANSPTSWKWSFGDGAYSTTKNPVHTYSKAGKYTVSLTVKNAKGSNTKTVSGYIVVAKK